MPADASTPPGGRISLLPILAVNFVGTLGFSIVIPFLVFLVTDWGGNALVLGLMGATYSAFQLIGAPVLGRWSDRIGRRKVLMLSQLGTLASWCVFLVAFFVPLTTVLDVDSTTLGQFSLTLPLILAFFARALDGLTGGNVSVANAYLADITDDDDRSANFGKMAVSGNLGFVIGPAIAGVLGATAYGNIVPVTATLLISVVALAIIVFRLQEYSPCQIEAAPSPRSVRKVFGQEHRECYEIDDADIPFAEVLRLQHVMPLLLAYFLVTLGFSCFYIGFPVHAAGVLQWSVAQTGTFFAFMSLIMVLVQGPLLSRLSKLFSETSLAVIGTAILAAGFFAFLADETAALYVGAAGIAVGNGLMWPSVMALLSKTGDRRTQGAIQGAGGSVGAVASIVGLVLGGVLYETFGASVFILAALTVLPVGAIVALSFRGKESA
ncbi:MAG: MFS transporter [Woeseiaceae bacterium]|nr:MFS transporter [Woeseiaceae bacterium]